MFTGGTKTIMEVIRYEAGQPWKATEVLVKEEALQIKINGKAYTITMRTPGQDSELAMGLLFTEGIISGKEDVLEISHIPAVHGSHTLVIDMKVKEEVLAGKNLFNRSIASSASCGVCGKIELCDLILHEPAIETTHQLDTSLIPALLERMSTRQAIFRRTGGSHAAAIFSIEGQLVTVQEDIGRHNAVDKVIGELLLREQRSQASILLVSGRVSYEIVAKCSRARIPLLLSVSAPSSLSVEHCQQKGITLVAFCRDNRATVYTHPQRIVQVAPTNPVIS